MALPKICDVAKLWAEPELRFTPGGKAVLTLPLVFGKRKKNANGEWEDAGSLFVRGTAWDDLAEHAAESFAKGDMVIVQGELYQRVLVVLRLPHAAVDARTQRGRSVTGFYYPGFSFLATCPRCAAPGPHHSGYLEAQPPTGREVETSPGEYELVRRWGAIPAGVKRTCTACGNGWQERLDR